MGSFISWFERSYRGIIIALVAIMAVALIALALQHVNASKPAAGATPRPIPTFGGNADGAAPERVPVAAGTRALIFGDSWTSGFFADEPAENGYASLTAKAMQWDASVQGGPGTGYTNAGQDGEGPYADRISKLPSNIDPQLIVLQGSVNDLGAEPGDLRVAAVKTVNSVKLKYPDASVVLVGPAATEVPVSAGLRSIDGTLRSVARAQDLNYISPLSEDWFNASNMNAVIDSARAKHPTTAGHALLAKKLVADLRALAKQ
jgi:lysophospholipase L1-like esterase